MAAVTEPFAALPGHLSRCPLLRYRVSIRSPRCVLRDLHAAGSGVGRPPRHFPRPAPPGRAKAHPGARRHWSRRV